jgi:hypothetical protein
VYPCWRDRGQTIAISPTTPVSRFPARRVTDSRSGMPIPQRSPMHTPFPGDDEPKAAISSQREGTGGLFVTTYGLPSRR